MYMIGNLLVALMTAVFAWCAFATPDELFFGSMSFFSVEIGIAAARLVFGICAALGALLLISGIRYLHTLLQTRGEAS